MFADDGISGTQAKKRPEFLRMIEECENGQIAMIITKSISRWARNTLDSLTYRVRLHDIREEKPFIDALRTRNGNLEISLLPDAQAGNTQL